MSDQATFDALVANTTPAAPRFRINRTVSLPLTTTYQRIDFNGTSAFNINNFPAGQIAWDSTNKIIKFNHLFDRNYIYTLYPQITATLAVPNGSKLMYRFVIPNGVSAGVDFYFPYPDAQATAGNELFDVAAFTSYQRDHVGTIYTNTAMLTNGLGIDMKLTTALPTSTVTLASMAILVQSR